MTWPMASSYNGIDYLANLSSDEMPKLTVFISIEDNGCATWDFESADATRDQYWLPSGEKAGEVFVYQPGI